MLMNIRKLDSVGTRGEASKAFQNQLDLSSLRYWGEQLFSSPVTVSGMLTYALGIVTISYTLPYAFTVPCARCLEPVTTNGELVRTHTIIEDADEDDDEHIPAPGGMLDLEALVRTDLILDLPNVILCSDECPGLCPVCGKNPGRVACGCVQPRSDSRFDILKQYM